MNNKRLMIKVDVLERLEILKFIVENSYITKI
jgi:hypothetical protein